MAATTDRNLLSQLFILSRFNRYNPLLAIFAGVWSTLLAGAVDLADPNSAISLSLVFRQTALCFLAAYIFCGAGMVWDDWVDRDIDANVERTKNRPLPSGKVTTTEAMVWMMLQVAVSGVILNTMLDGKDVWKHSIPLIVASILYPYGKRPFVRKLYVYPQYILAFALAWPAIPGRAAIHGRHESYEETLYHCLPLCIMVFFWVMYLNTAYSYQDVVDDRKMNVNSFYNIAGKHIHFLLVVLATPILVCLPLYLLQFNSAWLWVSWMGVWSVTVVRQLARFDPKQPASGGPLHKSNFALGIWTIIACTVQVFLNNKI